MSPEIVGTIITLVLTIIVQYMKNHGQQKLLTTIVRGVEAADIKYVKEKIQTQAEEDSVQDKLDKLVQKITGA